MATIRQGYLDDFTIKNSKVGIGTSDPTEALEVIGGSYPNLGINKIKF